MTLIGMQRNVRHCGILMIMLATTASLHASDHTLREVFESYQTDGTLVIQTLDGSQSYVHNIQRARERFSPASTFKVPNTLIALSQEVADLETSVFKWDGRQRWVNSWNQDHSLQSAYRVSCLWCYQQIAQRLSIEQYRTDLAALDYGNQSVGESLTEFWINGELSISAIEQIAFLKGLYKQQLPFPKAPQALTKTIMLEHESDHHRLYAKTGWAAGSINVGWYIGFVETQETTWFFAMNMPLPSAQQAPLRKKIVVDSLYRLMILPSPHT